jgi:hypothetical protein
MGFRPQLVVVSSLFFEPRTVGQSPPTKRIYIKKKGNKYLQQAQQEVRQTENGERGQKAKRPKSQKSQQNRAKQTITRLAARARWKDEDLL